ncbi:alpha-1,6-mannosylglycoprotein 6-beta-N-acetylglucosaminyltransferase B-like protein [Lates japonicus]|uniref:Alpha-1,6-mannosylglycoprotein 6-beta-N-acetylglucosaminyltransferase B-like protein n=1 Tax=Lates japonicus TaxID=270547 RepID=A0AAD3R4X0_LATJO|nr:alpha-1,6-mannosylglycoprotein 6-beta-N-acetylglucosaminyltransferase B-like protein [Lates japonicus]
MRVALRPRSGCLVLCLCLSVFTLLLQSLWVPLEITMDEPAGRSPEEQGQRGLGFRRLALRLEALSTQVQRLSRERDVTQLSRDDLSLLLQSFRQDQQSLARLVERELKRVSQRLDQLSRHHHQHHQSHTLPPHDDHRAHIGAFIQCTWLGVLVSAFEAMVKEGPRSWSRADLSACLTILGHNLTFSTSQQQLQVTTAC